MFLAEGRQRPEPGQAINDTQVFRAQVLRSLEVLVPCDRHEVHSFQRKSIKKGQNVGKQLVRERRQGLRIALVELDFAWTEL